MSANVTQVLMTVTPQWVVVSAIGAIVVGFLIIFGLDHYLHEEDD